MRAAARLLLTSPKWTRSQLPIFLPLKQIIQCRAAHKRALSAAFPTWNLGELWKVEKESGPLVFHLQSDDPYLNLSIEHYLLSRSHPDSYILLFYTNRPCVVIGRNQNPWLEVDLKRIKEGLQPEEHTLQTATSLEEKSVVKSGIHTQKVQSGVAPVDLVRRRSGGGTVFHDSGNLNYSVIVPNNKDFTRRKHAEMVVQALQAAKSFVHEYDLSSEQISDLPEVRVNDRNDIVMQRPNETEWLKVSGSAFKLTKGRALHHGTLLYSSPYIHRISDLLRSPGQGFITAKGVESVRSKVGNLAYTASPQARKSLRADITAFIVRQFWTMYGGDKRQEDGINEIELTGPSSYSELEGQNLQIADGVSELMSPSWIFEQTPRFDFKSGVLDNHELSFYADKGKLKFLDLESPVPGSEQNPGGLIRRKRRKHFGGTKGYGPRENETKLSHVEDWRTLLAQGSGAEQRDRLRTLHLGMHAENRSEYLKVNLPDVLVERLEAIFPLYPLAGPDNGKSASTEKRTSSEGCRHVGLE